MAYEQPEWLKRLQERLHRTTEDGEPEPGLAAGYQRVKGLFDAVGGALGWVAERTPDFLVRESNRWVTPTATGRPGINPEALKGVYEQLGGGIGEATLMAAEGLPRMYAPVAEALLPGKHGSIARYEMERVANRIGADREKQMEAVGQPEGAAEWASRFGGFVTPYAAIGGRVASLPVSLAADLALDVPIEAATREGSVLGMVADYQVAQAEEEERDLTPREALLDRLADIPAARGLAGGTLGFGAGGLLGALLDTGRAGQVARRGVTAAAGGATGAAVADEGDRTEGALLGAVAGIIGPEVLRDASRIRNARVNVAGMRRRMAEIVDPTMAAELVEAYTDGLTGFKNRAAWEKAVENGAEQRGVVLYLDMGNAHYSNDAQGWDYTDARFKGASEILARAATEEGVDPRQLFRPAGDEMIVAEVPSPEVAERIGQRVADEFGVQPITDIDGNDTGFANFFRWGVGDSFGSAAAAADAKKVAEEASGLTGARRAKPSYTVLRTPEAVDDAAMEGFTRPGHAYRGMTQEEFEATVAQGLGVHSRGDYSAWGEGTSYAHTFADAESYVNVGRGDPRVTKKPTYVVEVEAGGLNPNRQGTLYGGEPQSPIRAWMMEEVEGNIVAKEIKPRTLEPEQFSAEAREARAQQQGFNRAGYHGTVNGFEEFSDLYGNPDAYYGPGHYFTSSPEDASRNYARDSGPDVAVKREIETERFLSEFPDQYEENEILEYWRKQGRNVHSLDDLDEDEIAEGVASTRLGRTHGGAVLPVRIRMDNPFVIGGENETFFRLDTATDADGEITDWSGPAADLYRAVGRVVGGFNGNDARALQARLWEHLADYEGIAASDLDAMFRDFAFDAYTDEGGMLGSGEMLRLVLERLGHDGIDMDAYATFGPRYMEGPFGQRYAVRGMENLREGDRHYVVFHGQEDRIRSKWAKFHPSNVNRPQLMGFGTPHLVRLMARTGAGAAVGGALAGEEGGMSVGQGAAAGALAGALASPTTVRAIERMVGAVPGTEHGHLVNLVGKWFDRLDDAIEKGPGKGTAEAWQKYLDPSKRGFPSDELDWSGLRGFLAHRDPSEVLTKQQVQDIVEARRVRVQKEVLGASGSRAELDRRWGDRDSVEDALSYNQSLLDEVEQEIAGLRSTIEDGDLPTWPDVVAAADEIEALNGIGYGADLTDELMDVALFGSKLDQKLNDIRTRIDEWIESEGLDEDVVEEIDAAWDEFRASAESWDEDVRSTRDDIERLEGDATDYQERIDDFQEALDEYDSTESDARWSEHVQEGEHENYREVLLTIDGRRATIHSYKRDGETFYDVIAPDGSVHGTYADQGEASDALREAASNRTFVSSHWPGTRNVVIHVRIDDRTSAAARYQPVMFIEEIQSDWHQTPRSRAVASAGGKKEWAKLTAEDKRRLVAQQYEGGVTTVPTDRVAPAVEVLRRRLEALQNPATQADDEYGTSLLRKFVSEPLTEEENRWFSDWSRRSVGDRVWLNELAVALNGTSDYPPPGDFHFTVRRTGEHPYEAVEVDIANSVSGRHIGWKPFILVERQAGVTRYRSPEDLEHELRTWIRNVNENLKDAAVPEAPMKGTAEWVGLAVRNILQDAVAEGYNRVAWASGEQIARANTVRDRVEWLSYNADTKTLRAEMKDDGRVIEETVEPGDLGNWIGEAPAEQIFDLLDPPAPTHPDLFGNETPVRHVRREVTIRGEDLEVGGKGHMEFYNRIIPRQIKAELKALGVKNVELEVIDDLVEEEHRIARDEWYADDTLIEGESRMRSFLVDGLEMPDDSMDFMDIGDIFGNAAGTDDWMAHARRLGHGDILDAAEARGLEVQLHRALDEYYAARDAAMFEVVPGAEVSQNLSVEITDEIREAVRTKGTRLWSSPAAIAAVTSALAAQNAEERPTNPDLNPLLKVIGVITLAGAAGAAGRRVLRSRGGAAVDALIRGRAGGPTGAAIQRVLDSAKLTAINPNDYVNLSKFDLDPTGEQRLVDEIKQVVAQKGDRALGKERVSHEQTRALAQELGLAVQDIDHVAAARLTGAELLALRNVLSENVAEMERVAAAIAAARQLGNPADIRYAEMLMTRLERQTHGLLAKFIKGRAEAGRTLNSMKIIAKRSDSMVTWAVMAERAKGSGLTADELVKLQALLNAGDRVKLVEFIRSIQRAPLGEKLVTAWKAGLLTNPTTHMANLTGNTTMAFLETAKDAPAKLFDLLLRRWSGMDTKVGINATQLKASREGAAKGIEQAKQVMKTGVSEDDLMKYDIHREVNYDNPIADVYTKTIFRSLSAGDRVFKGAAFTRSIAEQAQLYARSEGFTGPKLHARVRELIDRPLDEMVLRATTDAEIATFLNRGILGEAGKKLRGVLGPVGEAIMPFVMTPANVASRVVEYAGGGAVRPFLPIGPQQTRHGLKLDWKTPDFLEFVHLVRKQKVDGLSPEELGKLYGLQKQMVEGFGRAVLGTGAIILGYELAANDMLTGNWPSEQNEQRLVQQSGLPTASIRVASDEEGGTWLALDRISPLGNLLVLGAELHRLSLDPDASAGSLLAGGGASVAQTLTSQSFLRGVQGVLDAMNDPDYSAYKFMKDQTASLVPAVVAAGARAVDPTMRETQTVSQAVLARIPFASRSLPARVDALGEDRQRTGGLLGAVSQTVSPFRVAEDMLGDSVRAELYKYGVGITVYRPTAIKAPDGTDILPPERGTDEYAEIQRRYGNAARERITEVMATPVYQRADDEEKAERLRKAVTDARRQVTAARKREYGAAS